MHTLDEYEKAYQQICKLLETNEIYIRESGYLSRKHHSRRWFGIKCGNECFSGIYLMEKADFLKKNINCQHKMIVDKICCKLHCSDIYGSEDFENRILIKKGTTLEQLLIGDDLKIS